MNRPRMRRTQYVRVDCYGNATTYTRSEPRKIVALGYVWRAVRRDDSGALVYARAEKVGA